MTPPSPLPDTVSFTFGDEVYHRTAPDEVGIVIFIKFVPGGQIIGVQWTPTRSSECYPFELSKDKVFSV